MLQDVLRRRDTITNKFIKMAKGNTNLLLKHFSGQIGKQLVVNNIKIKPY